MADEKKGATIFDFIGGVTDKKKAWDNGLNQIKRNFLFILLIDGYRCVWS